MATAGEINGTIIAITIGGVKIDKQLSASLTLNHDVRTWINKDVAPWQKAGKGKLSWEMSGEANLAFDSTYGMAELADAMINREEVVIDWTSGETGDLSLSGSAFVNKLESTPGVEETTNYSYGFVGSTALAKSVVV